MRRTAWLGGVLLALALGAAPASAAVQLTPYGSFTSPIYVTAPPGDITRVFVVERAGMIQVVSGGVRKQFLNIATDVDTTNERGLLSMAFAPDYATSGLFYVFYTQKTTGNVRIEEIKRSAADPDKADPATRRLIMDEPHSASNHNGGQLQFGPDGYLYATVGDNANGPNAQAIGAGNVFGKLLRVDPHTGAGPADNPFVGTPGADGRIFALGLRNPWRFSFDRATGQIVIGDVGSSGAGVREEIDIGAKGANFGWPTCEGFCGNPSFVDPVLAYDHSASKCAITGGYVVRADDLPSLAGRYIYGDYCGGGIRSAALATPVTDDRSEGLTVANLVSFGEDACGHLYAVAQAGTVSRVSEASPPAPCTTASLQQPLPNPSPTPGTEPMPEPQPATPAARDVRAPKLTVFSRKRQASGRRRHVTLTVACDETCRVKAQASLIIRGRKRLRLRGLSVRIDKRTIAQIPTSRRIHSAIVHALSADKRPRIELRVVAADAVGNAAPAVRRVVLVVR